MRITCVSMGFQGEFIKDKYASGSVCHYDIMLQLDQGIDMSLRN